MIHSACLYGNPEMVEYLISSKADLNLVDCSQRTPAMIAAYFGSYEILKLLYDNGADFLI